MFKGFSKNVFPVLAGPLNRMFRNFPLPFSSRSLTACEKASRDTSFHLRIWNGICSHCPLHWSTEGSSSDFSKSSSLVNLLRSITSLAFSISHEVAITSSNTLFPLLNTNSARSVLPSAFCTLASASSSVLLRIPLSMIIFETSKLLKRRERFRLTALLARLPSSISFSRPSLSSSLAATMTNLPIRHRGRLWLLVHLVVFELDSLTWFSVDQSWPSQDDQETECSFCLLWLYTTKQCNS